MTAKCRNCKVKKVNRPRGLCWTCYCTPGVRDSQLITSKHALRGNGIKSSGLPHIPLVTERQTSERIEELSSLAREGRPLFGEGDSVVIASKPEEAKPEEAKPKKLTYRHPRIRKVFLQCSEEPSQA
jgi:hypothetical protein